MAEERGVGERPDHRDRRLDSEPVSFPAELKRGGNLRDFCCNGTVRPLLLASGDSSFWYIVIECTQPTVVTKITPGRPR